MKKLRIIFQYNYSWLILLLIILCVSFIRCIVPCQSKYNLDDKSIEGLLTDYKIDGNKFIFIVKGKELVKGTYYIKTEEEKDEFSNLKLGVNIRINGELNEPSNNTIPNTFNYKKYLYYMHINYVMSADEIIVIDKKTDIFYYIKNSLINYISSFKSKGYLATFIIGNKNMLDDGVYEKYQDLGVSHVFAISGMHVSILAMVILKLMGKIKDSIKYGIVILFLLFYLFITNYVASVVRSVVLFICLYLNKRFNFNLKTIDVFYIAISIILIIDPFMMHNIGFIYSSLVSYSLIRYSFIIKGNYFSKCLKISLIAFMVSLPVTVNSYYRINILSFINNLFFVPAISFVVYPGSLITLIVKPFDNIYYFIMEFVELISSHLFVLNVIIPKMNLFAVIVYYALLYLFLNTYNKKYLVLMIVVILINKYKYLLDDRYYIYCMDVGQGDSGLVIHKDDVIMIDTGGKTSYQSESWMIGKKYYYTDNIITFLHSIGETDIDFLIISHGDNDHIGEAVHLIENIKVKNVKINMGSYNKAEYEVINTGVKVVDYYDSKINYQFLYSGVIYDNENDNSLVTYFDINGFKFLSMGDASTISEKDIMKRYNLSHVNLLKVGHHGSNTSSSIEFINKINPSIALISVGKNNKFGHPKQSVLDILNHSKILRTDIDGSIEIAINKNGYKMITYLP